jgi:hypothetical protein
MSGGLQKRVNPTNNYAFQLPLPLCAKVGFTHEHGGKLDTLDGAWIWTTKRSTARGRQTDSPVTGLVGHRHAEVVWGKRTARERVPLDGAPVLPARMHVHLISHLMQRHINGPTFVVISLHKHRGTTCMA